MLINRSFEFTYEFATGILLFVFVIEILFIFKFESNDCNESIFFINDSSVVLLLILLLIYDYESIGTYNCIGGGVGGSFFIICFGWFEDSYWLSNVDFFILLVSEIIYLDYLLDWLIIGWEIDYYCYWILIYDTIGY